MWDSSPVDQADEYGRNLLARKIFTDVEKFNLLRGISMTVAGIKANGKIRTSREELENLILGYYHERLVLDLDKHSDGIAANFTVEIMKRRVLGANKKLSKRKEEAIEKAEIKAAKKNVAAADPENLSAFECFDLFQEIKYEANNTFNPIWVKLLNKDGSIPSGVQLNDLLDKVREEAFSMKDEQRRVYLAGAPVAPENDSKESDNEKEDKTVGQATVLHCTVRYCIII